MSGRSSATCTSRTTSRASSGSGGFTRPAAGSGSRPSATRRSNDGAPDRTARRAGMSRLAERRGELIDRSAPVTFGWRGEQVTGLAGDTVASALFDSGVKVFSRSFKYHRPRGLLCCCRPVPELPRPDRRRTGRPRLHDAREGGHAGRPDQRLAVARDRRAARRRPRHALVRDAGRLLLQDVHPAALGLEVLREVPSKRGRARQARPRAPAHRAIREGAPPRRRARRRRRRVGPRGGDRRCARGPGDGPRR